MTIVSITLENSKIEESHRIECSPLTLDTGQEEIQRIRRDHRSEQSSFFLIFTLQKFIPGKEFQIFREFLLKKFQKIEISSSK